MHKKNRAIIILIDTFYMALFSGLHTLTADLGNTVAYDKTVIMNDVGAGSMA